MRHIDYNEISVVCAFCGGNIEVLCADQNGDIFEVDTGKGCKCCKTTSALQARITELKETIEDIKELAELASVDAKTLQSALFHLSTIGIIANKAVEDWNARPLEDALQARVEELEAENAILTAELAELNNKAVFIQFENEDELPADISSDIYSAMFNCSHVDVVRLFPYIKENGQKYYLVMLREDE